VSEISRLPLGPVLHIGPHKTGTTALQEAMRGAREDMLAQGVLLAGATGMDHDGVRYVLGYPTRRGEKTSRRVWEKISADLRDETVPRRVFSREAFASADSSRVRRVIDELGPVQVVVTARPLSSLLVSQYSQFAQRGAVTVPLEEWAQRVLDRDISDATVRRFWQRFDFYGQVRKWAAAVGIERLTVVVPDPGDRLSLPRIFEALLGLADGTLSRRIDKVRTNRSLNYAEIEMLRSVRKLAADSGMDEHALTQVVGLVGDYLRTHDPLPNAERPVLSADAMAEARRQAAKIADAVAGSGARVVGNLDALSH
jgi:hypothetical protein